MDDLELFAKCKLQKAIRVGRNGCKIGHLYALLHPETKLKLVEATTMGKLRLRAYAIQKLLAK